MDYNDFTGQSHIYPNVLFPPQHNFFDQDLYTMDIPPTMPSQIVYPIEPTMPQPALPASSEQPPFKQQRRKLNDQTKREIRDYKIGHPKATQRQIGSKFRKIILKILTLISLDSNFWGASKVLLNSGNQSSIAESSCSTISKVLKVLTADNVGLQTKRNHKKGQSKHPANTDWK